MTPSCSSRATASTRTPSTTISSSNIAGDCLLAVGDEDLIKIHFHTNTPWKVLEYCAGLGDIHDIVIENMERQENGLHG